MRPGERHLEVLRQIDTCGVRMIGRERQASGNEDLLLRYSNHIVHAQRELKCLRTARTLSTRKRSRKSSGI